MKKRIVLASGSKFRKDLLASTGLTFEIITSEVAEYDIVGASPQEQASKRALAKAEAVAKSNPLSNSIIIGADQVLSFNGEMFDKAKSNDEACQRLTQFAGNTHFLHSAYTLIQTDASGEITGDISRVIDVKMKMRKLTPEEIDAYVATGEWQGCVGCYRHESIGVGLFEEVSGNSSDIIGLPLLPVLNDLRSFGVNNLTC